MHCEMMPMLAGRVSWKVDDRTIIIVLEEVEVEVVGREEEESGKVVTMQEEELGEVAVVRGGMAGTDGGIDRISLLLILCYLYFDVFCWEGSEKEEDTC